LYYNYVVFIRILLEPINKYAKHRGIHTIYI